MNTMGKRKRSGSFSKTEECGAKKSDPDDSQEELDSENASCSTKGIGITGGGIRCSARVQEKQEKLRRESSPSKQILPVVEVPTVESVVNSVMKALLASKGISKSPNEAASSAGGETSSNTPVTPALEEKRKKRTWELWSLEDKQMFFEALNEFGKDFDAIFFYIATKQKSRNKTGTCVQYATNTKNRDQVRHFYYRTWNKISKYLRFPHDMKKVDQELYGLINYGELRKKQRTLTDKTCSKLTELVENGITSIKFRGKTCRVKTPVCNALKKLNGLCDIEHTRVPHKTTLEFIPKDGRTWRSVQSVSSNPRVKVVVSLQRTFASIISCLENKWKRKADRLKEQFSSVFGKPRAKLRVIPAERKDVYIPFYRVAANTSSATICLDAYKKKVLKCSDTYDSLSNSKRKRKQSGGQGQASTTPDLPFSTSTPLSSIKRLDYPVDAETSDAESQSAMQCQSVNLDPQANTNEEHLGILADQSDENAMSMKDEIFERHLLSIEDYGPVLQESENPVEENHSGDANQIQTETDNDDTEHDLDEAVETRVEKFRFQTNYPYPAESNRFTTHEWDEDVIRRGWTVDDAGVLTVGELYFMFGQTDKMVFEYSWDGMGCPEDGGRSHNLLERLLTTAMLLRKKKTARSKATTVSNTQVTCGSQLKCIKCGSSIEIPVNLTCSTKSCSNSNVGVPIAVRAPLPVARNRFNIVSSTEKQKSATVDLSSATTPPAGVANNPAGTDANQTIYLKSEPVVRTVLHYENNNYATFETADPLQDGIAPMNGLVSTPKQAMSSLSNFTSSNGNGALIELCSLASNTCNDPNIASHVKATLLPASSCMVRNPSGSISVVSQIPQETVKSLGGKEQITFHRPSHLRSLEPATPSGESTEFPPPKPFLDLPKGSRRLGRRPNFKRVVIPRVLPLLPKNQTVVSVVTSSSPADAGSAQFSAATLTVVPVSNISLGTGINQLNKEQTSGTKMSFSSTGGIMNSMFSNRNDTKNDTTTITTTTPVSRPSSEAMSYEMFLTNGGTLSCNSNDFEDLLKLRRQENNSNINAGDVDSLSLSSFMEMSLPESAKMAANECLNMDDLDNSNISLGLIRNLESPKDLPKDLETPSSSPLKRLISAQTLSSDILPDFDKSWSIDGAGGDLSLSNFFQFDSPRSSTVIPETETAVSYQAIIGDGTLDFSSKLTLLTELTSSPPISDSRK